MSDTIDEAAKWVKRGVAAQKAVDEVLEKSGQRVRVVMTEADMRRISERLVVARRHAFEAGWRAGTEAGSSAPVWMDRAWERYLASVEEK